jgi:hypothetical protein
MGRMYAGLQANNCAIRWHPIANKHLFKPEHGTSPWSGVGGDAADLPVYHIAFSVATRFKVGAVRKI